MQGIEIKGVQKTSLIDYPNKVCTVLFLDRCNFRCPFCHNPELVLGEIKETIPAEDVLDFLVEKKKWIDGVCITGGEPTLHSGLPEFIEQVKRKNLLVKLDTNGTNPKMLKDLIEKKLVDYVSMDIKADREGYDKASDVKVDMKSVQESINLLMESGIDYEFRTTVVPGLFDEKTAENLSSWLKGAKKFCLQQFRGSDRVLNPRYQNAGHYHIPELMKYKEILKKTMNKVVLRGI